MQLKKDIIDKFTQYKDVRPAGVLLPKIKIEKKHYSQLKISEDSSNYDFLRKLCLKAVKEKGIDKFKEQTEYFDRTKTELNIFKELGFVDYILLNWDILNYCHENNIPTNMSRGSTAGSLVLYLIDVTKVDPIKYDLFLSVLFLRAELEK